ncbi:3-isopropylmalate/(R)-2-methylmalate dehydratase small subunit [Bacillus pakistanensis]|uniref:3-isopropylmalate dehydratase small subunit n=1 Tax=Rossellomorea pakistanensis TaxID=992288 RepID=A0ABS2NJ53_9BACI|nr:3-isopropylmalate dehydratase small subunit [Bacillus pakistanensis]MBM7587843.1 3-isopropylmalate/(R)-2-methylmalate dehydratase small subunit [Bacillus pakistanensis]
MSGIRQFQGKVFPLNRENVDTDQIIPKQFLKKIDRQGFGQYLFYHWRFNDDGSPNKDFSLNNEKYQGATILVGGDNFGCGSSREHAPWSLLDYGFQVIIAPSFADIFYNNCVKNGILPIRLGQKDVEVLLGKATQSNFELAVDLEEQTVKDQDGYKSSFEIDPYWKQMLMNGWDEISITLSYEDQIKQFELLR